MRAPFTSPVSRRRRPLQFPLQHRHLDYRRAVPVAALLLLSTSLFGEHASASHLAGNLPIPTGHPTAMTIKQVPPESGCTAPQPNSITTDANGATWYTWNLSAGTTMQQVVPPATFHPGTAPPKELIKYMYPSPLIQAVRGLDPTMTPQAARSALLKPVTRFIGYNDCPFLVPANGYNGYTNTPNSGHWTGPTAPANNNYSQTYAAFNQPYYDTCPAIAINTLWAGLGGINGAALLQAGTQQIHSNANGGRTYDFAQVWADNSSNYTYGPTGPIAPAGDNIQPDISWYWNGGTNGTVYFDVYNNSTASDWPISYTLNRSQYGPGTAGWGATDEAISEDNGNYQQLRPSTGYVQWTGFVGYQYGTGNKVAFSGAPFDVFSMPVMGTNAASRSGSTFQDTWNSC